MQADSLEGSRGRLLEDHRLRWSVPHVAQSPVHHWNPLVTFGGRDVTVTCSNLVTAKQKTRGLFNNLLFHIASHNSTANCVSCLQWRAVGVALYAPSPAWHMTIDHSSYVSIPHGPSLGQGVVSIPQSLRTFRIGSMTAARTLTDWHPGFGELHAHRLCVVR
jgi:hypothetical protein